MRGWWTGYSCGVCGNGASVLVLLMLPWCDAVSGFSFFIVILCIMVAIYDRMSVPYSIYIK